MDDLDFIEGLLEEASEYGLLQEVVMFALQALKKDPTLGEGEAIMLGYNEWVK